MKALAWIAPLLFLVLPYEGTAQDDKYWVRFTDKDQTPYSIDSPSAYLSQAAIERREARDIPIDEKDLPVDPAYKDSVLSHPSVEPLHSSKWFNALTVHSTDSVHMDSIDQLPFVENARQVRSFTVPRPYRPKTERRPEIGGRTNGEISWHSEVEPGAAKRQLSMLGLDHLLELGHRGKGVRIAVLDAGFPGVDRMDAFAHLFNSGRYLGGFDAVESDRHPFRAGSHGRSVLSIMAAKKRGKMMGSAPEASYILCRTENGAYEYRVEEQNWIAAAEFADSAGADILSSSLGYTTFQDSTQDYDSSDMDGNTTLITRGADIAASRGMLIVNSAGNYGNSSWGIVGAPADGDSVLAIGSVDSNGTRSAFSSTGPTADARIKPDLMAMGEKAAFLGGDGNVYEGNGTSFSAPLISGAAACLWSAHPDMGPRELAERLKAAADRHHSPDNRYGHGIPNAYRAYLAKKGIEMVENGTARLISAGPNPFRERVHLQLYSGDSREIRIAWHDPMGRTLKENVHRVDPETHHEILLRSPVADEASEGLFFLELEWEKGSKKVIELFKRGGA